MTDETGAPAGGEPMAVADAPAQDTGGELSISQAARLLSQQRRKPEAAPVEQPDADPVEQPELAQANSDPATDPAEVTKEAEPAEQPPIEPPRSWTKEEKEAFAKWPREAQESAARVASAREADFRRSQNELADQRKAVDAERKAVTDERQKYINGLRSEDQILEREQSEKFPNIKSMSDLEFLSNEALRAANNGETALAQQIQTYLTAFQTHQQKIATVRADLKDAEHRQSSEAKSKWAEHVQTESAKFAESLSDADKAKIKEYMASAPEFMEARGFSRQELSDLWEGKERISLHDHRIQTLILDGMKYQGVQQAKIASAAKIVPPVQRPGTSKPAGSAVSAQIQALQEKFNRTGSLKDAQALHAAEQRRRA